MSSAAPWGRVTPRWSVVSAVWPVSNAGLVVLSAWVHVRPPLSASGARPGSVVSGAPWIVPDPNAERDTTRLDADASTAAGTALADPLATVEGALETTSGPLVELERIEFASVAPAVYAWASGGPVSPARGTRVLRVTPAPAGGNRTLA